MKHLWEAIGECAVASSDEDNRIDRGFASFVPTAVCFGVSGYRVLGFWGFGV